MAKKITETEKLESCIQAGFAVMLMIYLNSLNLSFFEWMMQFIGYGMFFVALYVGYILIKYKMS